MKIEEKMDKWKSIISAAVVIIGSLLVVFQTENSKVNNEVDNWESSFNRKIYHIDRESMENSIKIKIFYEQLKKVESSLYNSKCEK